MAVFTGFASAIQELAPVVAEDIGAGPAGLGPTGLFDRDMQQNREVIDGQAARLAPPLQSSADRFVKRIDSGKPQHRTHILAPSARTV
jgi:hypothetical protein